ncbi:MAG: DUF4968 domain-containing protein [Oligoflexus sp.]|nr:DUF4968 domain-containing protein [Pseudopedobacter sp.]
MKLYLFLLFVFPLFVEAQNLKPFKIYDHKKLEENNLKVYSEDGVISLTAVKPDVIKVYFSALPDINYMVKTDKMVYVRVTQNLDDIFMQTDSLLIIINKLDFSIKYKSIKEKLFLANDVIIDKSKSFLNFKIGNGVKIYKSGKQLKDSNISFKKQIELTSSENYSLILETDYKGFLKIDESNNLQFKTNNHKLGYYFIAGNK